MIRLILVLILLIFTLILSIENKEEVELLFLFGYSTGPIPLFVVLFSACLLGALATLILTLPPWVRNKVEIRRLKRAIQKMEEKNANRTET
jgi:uncharacterized integral membrane protein